MPIRRKHRKASPAARTISAATATAGAGTAAMVIVTSSPAMASEAEPQAPVTAPMPVTTIRTLTPAGPDAAHALAAYRSQGEVKQVAEVVRKQHRKIHPGRYTVVAGDTLSAIARGHDMTWPKLWAKNHSKIKDPDLIYAGQRLRLTGPPEAAPVVKTEAKITHVAEPETHVKVHHKAHHHAHALPGHQSAKWMQRDVIRFVTHQLGKAYLWGGTGPSAFDCSGLVMEAYAAAGIAIPRTSQAQWAWAPHVERARPGDLVFFGSSAGPHHVGLVIGGGRMIESSHPGVAIRVANYELRSDVVGFGRPWLKHHEGVRHQQPKPHKALTLSHVGQLAHGFLPANYRYIAAYLMSHGYSKAAAAGILGNMWQESGGNPESGTPSAGGLIGWTGNWSSYSSSAMQTGSPWRDLTVQLRALLRYNETNGSRGDINAHASSAAAAASHYCFNYERPGIPALSSRIAAANAVYSAL